MIGFKLNIPKSNFFDRAAVINMMDKKTHRNHSRFGAYVMRRARKSMPKRKGISKPGAPPFAHVGTLKRLIFFAYDRDRRTVVIGPLLFNNKLGNSGAETLEKGGTVTAKTKAGVVTVMVYRARPYMQPAYDAEIKRGTHLEGYKK